jgi:hypothetical protein
MWENCMVFCVTRGGMYSYCQPFHGFSEVFLKKRTRHFSSAAVRFSWHHENRTHSNVPERSKHNYTRVCGHRPHLHELRHIRHFTHNQLYPAEFSRITFFFRPTKTIMKLLKMAASVRFMKLMVLH